MKAVSVILRVRVFVVAGIVLLSYPGAARSYARDSSGTFHAGLIFRKMAGFYTLNGFSGEYRPRFILGGKFRGGISLTSSVLGTALFSRAIPVFCYEVYGQYQFRKTGCVRPFVTISGGYAYASYGSEFKDRIPSSQSLLAPELGFSAHARWPVDLHLSVGYNFITGDGTRGLGVIYPVFFQLRSLIRIR